MVPNSLCGIVILCNASGLKWVGKELMAIRVAI